MNWVFVTPAPPPLQSKCWISNPKYNNTWLVGTLQGNLVMRVEPLWTNCIAIFISPLFHVWKHQEGSPHSLWDLPPSPRRKKKCALFHACSLWCFVIATQRDKTHCSTVRMQCLYIQDQMLSPNFATSCAMTPEGSTNACHQQRKSWLLLACHCLVKTPLSLVIFTQKLTRMKGRNWPSGFFKDNQCSFIIKAKAKN